MKFLMSSLLLFSISSISFAGGPAEGELGDTRPPDTRPPELIAERCPSLGSRGLSIDEISLDCIEYTPLSTEQQALISRMYGQLSPGACGYVGLSGYPAVTVNTNGNESTNVLCEARHGNVSGVLCSANEIRCNQPGFIGEFTIPNVIFFAQDCSSVSAIEALQRSVAGGTIQGQRRTQTN